MTKEQKALAHLARAQELLNAQGTLAFGGVSLLKKKNLRKKSTSKLGLCQPRRQKLRLDQW